MKCRKHYLNVLIDKMIKVLNRNVRQEVLLVVHAFSAFTREK